LCSRVCCTTSGGRPMEHSATHASMRGCSSGSGPRAPLRHHDALRTALRYCITESSRPRASAATTGSSSRAHPQS
jgi:hypothetical protein